MADENRKLVDREVAIHLEYAHRLKDRGFCTLDDATANHSQLFNCINQHRLPLSFLPNDFGKWLREHGRQCDEFRPGLILTCLPHVIGSRFIPKPTRFIDEPATGCTFVNTYRRYSPVIDDAECDGVLQDLFDRMFPDALEQRTVKQWLGHMFQHPEERPSWHLMWPSDTGTGKGFMIEKILHPLLHHTSVISNYSQVTGQFSGVLASNLLVLIDDAKAKSDATQTQLKSLLSEERAFVEKKYGDAGMVKTYTRFILASNEDRPLKLEANERRWYVTAKIGHRHSRSETAAFIGKLAAWLELPGSLDRVFNYFMGYDLTGFNPKSVPDSSGLAAMIEMSHDPFTEFLRGYVSDHCVFRYADMVEDLRQEGMTKPSDRELVHLLREVGYEKSQPRIEGKLLRLCHPAGMSLAAIRENYREPESAF
jgi:hypothetical protein